MAKPNITQAFLDKQGNIYLLEGNRLEEVGVSSDNVESLQSDLVSASGSLQSQIDDKSSSGHTHTESDITDLGNYIDEVASDNSPSLGGDLDGQNFSITDLVGVLAEVISPSIGLALPLSADSGAFNRSIEFQPKQGETLTFWENTGMRWDDSLGALVIESENSFGIGRLRLGNISSLSAGNASFQVTSNEFRFNDAIRLQRDGSTPEIYYNGDTDTGIDSPEADVIALRAGGFNRVVASGSDGVGVDGTLTAGDVVATSSLNVPVFASDPDSPNDGDVWVNSGDNSLRYRVGGSTLTVSGS